MANPEALILKALEDGNASTRQLSRLFPEFNGVRVLSQHQVLLLLRQMESSGTIRGSVANDSQLVWELTRRAKSEVRSDSA